jgi:hypothetical protein
MKDQLVFDTTDSGTIADSDSVGAYLRASDGTLLTHTDVGGKKALDVRLAEGVNVEVDLSHIDDSVRLGDGTSFFTSTSENGDIALDVHISNTSVLVNDAALANTAIASGATALSVANTAQDAVASPLSARKYLFLYNNDSKKMYIGQSGVSAANGFPVSPGAYVELRAGAAIDLEFVSAQTSHDLRYLELS